MLTLTPSIHNTHALNAVAHRTHSHLTLATLTYNPATDATGHNTCNVHAHTHSVHTLKKKKCARKTPNASRNHL